MRKVSAFYAQGFLKSHSGKFLRPPFHNSAGIAEVFLASATCPQLKHTTEDLSQILLSSALFWLADHNIIYYP